MPDAQPRSATVDTNTPAPPVDLTGRVLGDYQLLRRLGVGGMGQVYLARQLSLKRQVALKLLRNDLSTNTTALKRFQGEAEAVARLNHPNIVHIHQIGEHDGLRYMVLEYVEGRNLRDYLARKGPPDLAVIISVIRQVVLALQKAHEEGIVHRDIKPENILLTRKVEVKVADFGLSRFFAGETPATNLTQSGVTLGTPLYMSPEQVQGHTLDHRSDIYSLGVTCYHLLTGEPPFRGATAFDVALKHVQDEPRPIAELRPDLPADLCGMVHKMMAKTPGDRYQSAREILRDLSKVRDGIIIALGQTPGQAGVPAPNLSLSVSNTHVPLAASEISLSTPVPIAEPVRWHYWVLVAVACLAAAGAGVLLFGLRNPAAESAQTANSNPNSQPAPAGLPDVRAVEKLVTTRERELVALLDRRGAEPQDVLKASIELGLLYLKDRRLDDADARFKKLETESLTVKKLDKPEELAAARHASLAGRLGQAIVLAYRDPPKDDPTAPARQSNDLVVQAITIPYPKLPPKFDKFDKGSPPVVANFLLKNPDLAQALADALNRNALALGKTTLTPAALEQLRNPPKGGRKD